MNRCFDALKIFLRLTWCTKIVYLNHTQRELILRDQCESKVNEKVKFS